MTIVGVVMLICMFALVAVIILNTISLCANRALMNKANRTKIVPHATVADVETVDRCDNWERADTSTNCRGCTLDGVIYYHGVE